MQFQINSGNAYPLGAHIQDAGTNFAIFCDQPGQFSLCLFEEKNPDTPFQEIELSPLNNKTGSIWHIFIRDLPAYTLYAYRLKNENNENNQNSDFLLDPYAKSVAGRSTWNTIDGVPTTYNPLGRVIPFSNFDWENDKPLEIPKKDLIIYEMHVRGFTCHPSSQVSHPGSYLGIIEKIPFLKDLGINAIELLPIHEFNEEEAQNVNPKTHKKLCNYFGYSTVNYFSPMARYASQSDQDHSVIEFKTMVRELHKNGIEVILDVVFNHTFEGNEKGLVQCYRGLSPNTYYMIDENGNYLNYSGCGNTVNSNHPIVIELIISALRYWVTEMHVDGFRFDLASIMTRSDNGSIATNAPLVEAISQDPILANTKLIAEPWDAAGLYQVGAFTPASIRWSEWNGKYRDVVRRFIKGTADHKKAFATVISGSQDLYGHKRLPHCSVNFVTAHDGFSLADLVSYNEKHNELNGEDNRDGFSFNDSWNCGFEGHSSNKKIIALRERQIRNFHVALMVSQGIPMVLMGDEYAHTRDGNNNTWCQDNELNWFLWDHIENRPGFYRFFHTLIDFRKKNPLLGRDTFLGEDDITWHGIHPNQPDWDNDNRFIAFTLNNSNKIPELYVAFNVSHLPIAVTLPSLGEAQSWFWLVNTHETTPEDILDEPKRVESTIIRIYSYSSIILQAMPTTPSKPD